MSLKESLKERLQHGSGPSVQQTALADGTTVYLRRIQESQYAIYEAALYDPTTGKLSEKNFQSQRRRLLAMTLCDANGELLFEHPNELATMDAQEAMFLHDEYRRLFPRPTTESVKSAEKKSDPVPESDTPSA
jgi:hypothetical protein